MESLPQTKFQFAILAENPSQLGGFSDTSAIEWLFCEQTGQWLFDFYRGNSMVSSINLEKARLDLPNLLGMIVVGSGDTFDSIKECWNSKLPGSGLAFRQVASASHEAVLSAALECIANVLMSQRHHAGRNALDLATYRREFERLQHNFARVEEYVGQQTFPQPIEIFEYPPDPAAATVGCGDARTDHSKRAPHFSIAQYLPVDSLGMSRLSIFISSKPDPAAEALQIKLGAIETEQKFATWSVLPEQVEVGWVELALEHAIDQPALSLVVALEWRAHTKGWAVALGSPHPYKEFCARVTSGEYLAAPLALRICSSLPGVRVAATTSAIRPANASPISTEFIPYEKYGTVVQVVPPLYDNKPALVSYDPDIGCITVHPGGSGATVGRMHLAIPKQAWGLTAQIHLANERASPAQFGLLGCAPRDESKELARLDHLDMPSQTFSGWKTLSALERKSITLLLANPPEERLSVYLVTRQAPDVSPDFAWARFSKLEFNLLPKPFIVQGESSELAAVEIAPSDQRSEN